MRYLLLNILYKFSVELTRIREIRFIKLIETYNIYVKLTTYIWHKKYNKCNYIIHHWTKFLNIRPVWIIRLKIFHFKPSFLQICSSSSICTNISPWGHHKWKLLLASSEHTYTQIIEPVFMLYVFVNYIPIFCWGSETYNSQHFQ